MTDYPKWLTLLRNDPHVRKKRLQNTCSDSQLLSSDRPNVATFKKSPFFKSTRNVSNLKPSKPTLSPLGVFTRCNKRNSEDQNLAELAIHEDTDDEDQTECERTVLCFDSDSSEDHMKNGVELVSGVPALSPLTAQAPFLVTQCDNAVKDMEPAINDDQLDFVLSSGSDCDVEIDQRIIVEPLNHRLPPKLDTSVSTKAVHTGPVSVLELPSKRELRCALSSRLATRLRRIQSDRVIWQHSRSNSSDVCKKHPQAVFSAQSVFIQSPSRTVSGHVIINSSVGEVLILSTALFTDAQWTLLKEAALFACSLVITLTAPWSEISLPNSDKRRIIYAPYFVTVEQKPPEPRSSSPERISTMCSCFQTNPADNSWSTCKYRFGFKVAKPAMEITQKCTSTSTTLVFLVLQKSLIWFQGKLRFAFMVKFAGGGLSVFLLPTSICSPQQCKESESLVKSSHELSFLSPGCVYSIKSLPTALSIVDKKIGRKVRELWVTFAEILRGDDRLSQFIYPDDSEYPPCLVLKTSEKFQLSLQMSVFSENIVFPLYSPMLQPNSRCSLNGILLHEFPSGSGIAEKVLALARSTCGKKGISGAFVIISGSMASGLASRVHHPPTPQLVVCTSDAATPITLLTTSNHLSPCPAIAYGQHRSCRVRLSIAGAIITSGFFVLDAFSRIELLDVDLLPVTSGKCIRHHSFPPAFDHSRPDGLLNLSLITTSGVVVGVDSSASQVWPLCPGCLSDELKHPLDKVAATALECSRCQAKIDKPFHAMEVVVELGVDEQTDSVCSIQSDAMQRRCVKVCMLPSQLAEMVCLSEAQLLQPSLVNPNCLIGRPVDFLLGTLIMLPSVRGSQDFAHQCQAVIVQLPSNLLTSLAHSVTSVPC